MPIFVVNYFYSWSKTDRPTFVRESGITMGANFTVGIKINENYCSACAVCSSVCPYEAISLNENTGKVELDVEKCQVCGICSSACPVSAIELAYYDNKALVSYVEKQMHALGSRTLVLACRGSTPPCGTILEALKEENVKNFISLRLPCVGRVSPEFFIRAITLGIDKIIVLQCDEDYCRFKRGSETNTRRLLMTSALLQQLGFKNDVFTIVENPSKATYDTKKCVGCDKCTFICPYDAIEVEPLATPRINLDACVGCGACALVCPHLAIQLEGFEYEPMSRLIHRYSVKASELRSEGIKPVVLVFCCQWAEFSALDGFQNSSHRKNAMIIEIPCFKGLDPVHILDALYSGFDGVLAVTCTEDECKLEKGRDIAEQNVATLKKTLAQLDLLDRFTICTASPKYLDDFDLKLDAFIEEISSLPTLGKR